MVRVKIRYFGLARGLTKRDGEELELKEATILGLLSKLVEIYGESFKKLFSSEVDNILDPSFVITVNGIPVNRLNGVKTRLAGGDRVDFMTLVSGG